MKRSNQIIYLFESKVVVYKGDNKAYIFESYEIKCFTNLKKAVNYLTDNYNSFFQKPKNYQYIRRVIQLKGTFFINSKESEFLIRPIELM